MACTGPSDSAASTYRLGPTMALQGSPSNLSELADGSIIVADDGGGPAQRVWLNDFQRAPELLPGTEGALAVVAVENGYLVVQQEIRTDHRVARIGAVSWKNKHFHSPWTVVLAGDTALVSCRGYGNGRAQVVRLDLQNGDAIGSLGKGVLQHPTGVSLGASGTILVADVEIYVFAADGKFLRILGRGLCHHVLSVWADRGGRMCVATLGGDSVLVLDQMGTRLADIALPWYTATLLVTRTGKVVVGLENGGLSTLLVLQ